MLPMNGLKCPNQNCPSNKQPSYEQFSLGYNVIGGPAEPNTAFVVWFCKCCGTVISVTAAKQR